MDYLAVLMTEITKHINQGGRFAGNFFGPDHSWNYLCLVSIETIILYFKDFEIEYIHETKELKTSALGEEIFFHTIDVLAKKISAGTPRC